MPKEQWAYSYAIGSRDLSGTVTPKGLLIERLAHRNPIKWAVRCEKCNTRWNEAHATVLSVGCRRGVHCLASQDEGRKDARLLDESRNLAEQHENAAAKARQSAALARMEHEVDGYELPTRKRPDVPSLPRSVREQTSLAEYRAEIEAKQTAEHEIAEAPIRQAEREISEALRKLNKIERERLEGKVRDPHVVHDPALNGVRMSEAEAEAYNREEFHAFCKLRPEVRWNDDLINAFDEYFSVNGVRLASRVILDSLVTRFLEAGLLSESPNVEPEHEDKPLVEVEAAVAQKEPDEYQGIDPDSGLQKTYTKRQVDRMSADQYRRCFPVLQNVGELLTAMRNK